MYENQNYFKKFNIKSPNNIYTITIGALEKNNEKLLYIKLIHQFPDRNLIYYAEKTLKEIHKENKHLEKYKLINDLIDYLSELIKDDCLGINKNDPNIYKLNFIDKNKDKYIFFPLKREKEITEIKDKILEKSKILEDFNPHTKFKEMVAKIEMLQSEIDYLKKLNENQTSTDLSFSSIEKSKPFGYENKNIINTKNEKCEIFIAFQLQNEHPIIAWTAKSRKNEINIENLFNNLKSSILVHTSQINCLQYFHNENIDEKNDYIITFSENDEKAFKIWLLLNEKDLKLKVIMTNGFLKMTIEQFCAFNNKYYSNENSFIFLHGKCTKMPNQDRDKGINCYKFDNELNLKNWDENFSNNNNNLVKIINNNEKVNYLNTFYYLRGKKLYLITCTDNNLNVIENPFYENTKIFFNYNNEKYHLNAFMIERNDNFELFDSNLNGIYVWAINNNNKIPQLKLQIDINNSNPYDICLWNNDYLWASTSSGFFFIQINENKLFLKIEESEYKSYSKVNKISYPKEEKSIIGLDNDDNLCLWHIIDKE